MALEVTEIVVLFIFFLISLLSSIFAGLYISDLKNLKKAGVNIKQRKTIAIVLMTMGISGIIISLLTFIFSSKIFSKIFKKPVLEEKERKVKKLEKIVEEKKRLKQLEKKEKELKSKKEGKSTVKKGVKIEWPKGIMRKKEEETIGEEKKKVSFLENPKTTRKKSLGIFGEGESSFEIEGGELGLRTKFGEKRRPFLQE